MQSGTVHVMRCLTAVNILESSNVHVMYVYDNNIAGWNAVRQDAEVYTEYWHIMRTVVIWQPGQ